MYCPDGNAYVRILLAMGLGFCVAEILTKPIVDEAESVRKELTWIAHGRMADLWCEASRQKESYARSGDVH